MIAPDENTTVQFRIPNQPLVLVQDFPMDSGSVPWAVPAAYHLTGGAERQHWTDKVLDVEAAKEWAAEMLKARSGGACQVKSWIEGESDGFLALRPVGRYTTHVLTLRYSGPGQGQWDAGARTITYASAQTATRAIGLIRSGVPTLELPRKDPAIAEYVMLSSVREFTVETTHHAF